MKPFTFHCGAAPRGYFAQQKKRGAEAAFDDRLATRMLSNVQLLPGANRFNHMNQRTLGRAAT